MMNNSGIVTMNTNSLYNITWDTTVLTPSGAAISISSSGNKKRVGVSLYFKFVKSKLKKHEKEIAKQKLNRLKILLASVSDTEQQALYEELSKQLVNVVRDIEAAAAGYDKAVLTQDVEKFKSIVSELGDDSVNFPRQDVIVYLTDLASFPRPLPEDVKKCLARAKTLGLFDKFMVLYLNYSEQKMKTTKEKIREKDPILFGIMNTESDRLYYITDWVDEYCDLTLDKLVDTIKMKDVGYKLEAVAEIDDRFLEKLKTDVKKRHDMLQKTRASNYRGLMVEAEAMEKKPSGFWTKFRELFRG